MTSKPRSRPIGRPSDAGRRGRSRSARARKEIGGIRTPRTPSKRGQKRPSNGRPALCRKRSVFVVTGAMCHGPRETRKGAECLDRGATQDQRTAASSLHPHPLVNDFDGLATGDIEYLPAGSSGIQFFNHGIFFRCQTAPLKYSYMLGGMFSSCSSAMCLRTISEYKKRSPQMRQCHWSRAKMYGRHANCTLV
jgi:hypothetical protein